MQAEATTDAEALERGITALWTMLLRGTSSEVSRTALSVLARVRDAGPQRVTALATHESVAQPMMTALVGRLQARGLVERGEEPGDGRAVRVAITAAGLEALGARRAERSAPARRPPARPVGGGSRRHPRGAAGARPPDRLNRTGASDT